LISSKFLSFGVADKQIVLFAKGNLIFSRKLYLVKSLIIDLSSIAPKNLAVTSFLIDES
jgi:hypothetical protein